MATKRFSLENNQQLRFSNLAYRIQFNTEGDNGSTNPGTNEPIVVPPPKA